MNTITLHRAEQTARSLLRCARRSLNVYVHTRPTWLTGGNICIWDATHQLLFFVMKRRNWLCFPPFGCLQRFNLNLFKHGFPKVTFCLYLLRLKIYLLLVLWRSRTCRSSNVWLIKTVFPKHVCYERAAANNYNVTHWINICKIRGRMKCWPTTTSLLLHMDPPVPLPEDT